MEFLGSKSSSSTIVDMLFYIDEYWDLWFNLGIWSLLEGQQVAENVRNVERGSKIVTAVAQDTKLILQVSSECYRCDILPTCEAFSGGVIHFDKSLIHIYVFISKQLYRGESTRTVAKGEPRRQCPPVFFPPPLEKNADHIVKCVHWNKCTSTRAGRGILIFELVGHDMLLLDQVRWVQFVAPPRAIIAPP